MTSYHYKIKNKKGLAKKACEKWHDLSEEEKDKSCQYVCERYINLSEQKKEKKRQYGCKQIKIFYRKGIEKNF